MEGTADSACCQSDKISSHQKKIRSLKDDKSLFENHLTYAKRIRKMPNKRDKFGLRPRMVKYALANGINPTVRLFATTSKTVRKWLGCCRQKRSVRRRSQKRPLKSIMDY